MKIWILEMNPGKTSSDPIDFLYLSALRPKNLRFSQMFFPFKWSLGLTEVGAEQVQQIKTSVAQTQAAGCWEVWGLKGRFRWTLMGFFVGNTTGCPLCNNEKMAG